MSINKIIQAIIIAGYTVIIVGIMLIISDSAHAAGEGTGRLSSCKMIEIGSDNRAFKAGDRIRFEIKYRCDEEVGIVDLRIKHQREGGGEGDGQTYRDIRLKKGEHTIQRTTTAGNGGSYSITFSRDGGELSVHADTNPAGWNLNKVRYH